MSPAAKKKHILHFFCFTCAGYCEKKRQEKKIYCQLFRVEAVGRLKRPLVSQVVSVVCCFARSWWLTTLVSIKFFLTHHRHNHVQSAANQGNIFVYFEKTWKDFQDFKPLCRDQEVMTVPPDKTLNPIPCFVAYRRLPRLTFTFHYLLNSHNHLDNE